MVYSYDYSFVDFPGKYAIVLFFTGCNLRCDFCYNRELLFAEPRFTYNEVVKSFEEQVEMMGQGNVGIVFSGGEPTVSPYFHTYTNLKGPMALHTNGLFVPRNYDQFQSVVISLKPRHAVTWLMSYEKYLKQIQLAIDYYQMANRLEIRWVDNIPNVEQPDEALSHLKGEFLFSKVDYIKEE